MSYRYNRYSSRLASPNAVIINMILNMILFCKTPTILKLILIPALLRSVNSNIIEKYQLRTQILNREKVLHFRVMYKDQWLKLAHAWRFMDYMKSLIYMLFPCINICFLILFIITLTLKGNASELFFPLKERVEGQSEVSFFS